MLFKLEFSHLVAKYGYRSYETIKKIELLLPLKLCLHRNMRREYHSNCKWLIQICFILGEHHGFD